MKKIFITYGDSNYELTKRKLLSQVKQLDIFDNVKSYSPSDLSLRVKQSSLMKIDRGGGLWVWKPDIILQALKDLENGDILVYCDAGCAVKKSKEWEYFFSILNKHDICAFKILQKNKNWTRHEIIEYFGENSSAWLNKYQCAAGVIILKKTDFIVNFINEWLFVMLNNPNMVMDVLPSERHLESLYFKENRHDQAVFSALIYQNYNKGYISLLWEHFEGVDYVLEQAIIAARNHDGMKNKKEIIIVSVVKMLVKRVVYCFLDLVCK